MQGVCPGGNPDAVLCIVQPREFCFEFLDVRTEYECGIRYDVGYAVVDLVVDLGELRLEIEKRHPGRRLRFCNPGCQPLGIRALQATDLG